ncbi:coiled-coil domain-containing protein [Actinomadura sp. 9N407]|uniref:coiled-coil domain-containing protein n=1 Tax=Actinomadura sp. 9N407 TaxID=3375154 RepID=UPI003787D368
METPSSTRRWRTRLRRPALALAVLAGGLSLTAGSAGAAPVAPAAPTAYADPGDSARFRKLNQQIAKLEKAYGGDLAKQKNAQYGIKKAQQKAKDLQVDLNVARGLVAQLAASQYMTGGTDPSVGVLSASDPSSALSNLSLVSHVAQNQSNKVQQIQALVNEQEKARQEYEKKVKDLEKDLKDLLAQKTKIQALVKRYKPESPSVGMGGVTPRMRKVKDTLDVEFGPFPTIGCVRGGGDAQDHATGQACDFMVSTGGSMPGANGRAQGDRAAQYAIANASRLGVKYVIWRQRIYDMRSPGWRAMENRGGTTANHYDHVHISVF